MSSSGFISQLRESLLGGMEPREGGECSRDDNDHIEDTSMVMVDDAKDEFSEVDYMFGHVCALCHDGGEVLCCDGRCLRSFHATPEPGCTSLNFTKDTVDAMGTFLCENCRYQKHQCFVCGELGSSDKSSGSAEVFACVSPVCGQFYHAHCVAGLLSQQYEVPANELEKKIAMGESFTCPSHKCYSCLKGENTKDPDLQFAVCHRCPTSYHRKCLPRKHKVDVETGTFFKHHIKFPFSRLKRKLKPDSYMDIEKGASMMINSSLEESHRRRRANTEFKHKEKPSFATEPENLAPNTDRKRRILEFMEKAASSVTLEDIKRKYQNPYNHAQPTKYYVDKKISKGKVEVSVEAVRTALRKLKEGCSVEDAEAVCGRDVLQQIFSWKHTMTLYLGPFLHGMRYTTFGRHFTKVEKLEQIVDRLHWYVKSGDTIVDFCCGSNDFSVILKKKLEETGKNCYYKNYDLFQSKIDFSFEKKDWMTVQREELPIGSRLIMGLNPPFGGGTGFKANEFINKALEFNPKLIILIVPPVTQRLDKKGKGTSPYDLIWEDEHLLAGKSFYLPGSVDVHDKQLEQWNNITPPLYLWSHRDWSPEHRAIAQEHGHISLQ